MNFSIRNRKLKEDTRLVSGSRASMPEEEILTGLKMEEKRREWCDSVCFSCVCVSGRSFLIPIKLCCEIVTYSPTKSAMRSCYE